MKQLLAGSIVILVLGVAAFFYRNTLEHPSTPVGGNQTACTQEAKICPDGVSVGRTGPNCSFAVCPAPNVALASARVEFVLPQGYLENKNTQGTDGTRVALYEKQAKNNGTLHSLIIRDYPIATGRSATSTMLGNTTYEASGEPAKAMTEFKTITDGGNKFYCVTLERFEGQVHTACYLPRSTDVLRFEILEKDVDWTNPKLIIEELPEHTLFYHMLTTLHLN